MRVPALVCVSLLLVVGSARGDLQSAGTVDPVVVGNRGTDAEAVSREGEAISPPSGLSPEQQAAVRAKADNFTFQTEVNRMMKLIINSLYRNKEIFLRELISNASDALDKVRLLALTEREALSSTGELSIRITADAEKRLLHITDTGVGMTRQDLVNNLGTIAKSGTADFLATMQDGEQTGGAPEMNDMIGQFGVGFYSAFLVADKVTVVSKHDNDDQHVWESDANSFSVSPDPRGNTLKRGTQITLHIKEEAADFLQPDTIRQLVKKYSQFINFPIYLWASRTETVEEPVEPEAKAQDDDDAQVEDAAEEEPKTTKTEKTVWSWELMNDNKPIWTRKPTDVSDEEYDQFYRSLTKDTAPPLTKVHFVAEGEVSFRALLFVPRVQPQDSFNKYGSKTDHIKLFVRRVFISDEFNDLMPSYLAFVRGVVDSDDLPLNVSRETLQQHKLIKVIKKKLVRKVLDVLRRIPEEEYATFWKEYSTNIKLGIMEDPSNRARLAKLLRFASSAAPQGTSLEDYVARMRSGQKHIYYTAGASLADVERAPFAERLVARGYEVLYLTEAVDEYCLSSLPEFDGHKFQNIAKEIFDLDESDTAKERFEEEKKRFEPLTKWLGDQLGEWITRAAVSKRLQRAPAALVATVFGWTGNMERLAMSNAHQKADDAQRKHQLSQKKLLEINPRHPVLLELLRLVTDDPASERAIQTARTLYRTAALRSGYMLQDAHAADLADHVDAMMQVTLGLPADAVPVEEPLDDEDASDQPAGDSEATEDQHEEL